MGFSTVPQFKIFFNIDFTGEKRKRQNGKSKSVKLTKGGLAEMQTCFCTLRKGQNGVSTD